jgi:hypothetical protein
MKKLLLIILIFKVFQCKGQEIVKGSIELKDSTINRTITFNVPKGTTKIDYSAKGHLTEGMLSLTVTNPDGKPDGGFQLSCEPNKHGGISPKQEFSYCLPCSSPPGAMQEMQKFRVKSTLIRPGRAKFISAAYPISTTCTRHRIN